MLSVVALMFLAPNLVFAANFQGIIVWEVVFSVAIAAWFLFNRPGMPASPLLAASVDPLRLVLCLCLGGALVVVGGEGHLVFTNSDWFWRDAILADLIRSPGLPHYIVSGVDYSLRAPLGLYMLPALAGRVFGLGAGHAAMAAQNGLILGLLLYGFSMLMGGRRAIRVLIFLAFGGLDIVGFLLLHRQALTMNPIDFPSMLVWTFWQYSSQILQIFWVPNHALPGWWLALLILLCAEGEISLGYLGLALAITLFWAPLPALGAAPFLLALFFKRPVSHLRDPWLWAHFCASLLFLPFMAYLLVAAEQIPHTVMPHTPLWILSYILFEILNLALPFCVLLNWKYNPPALNVPAVVAILTLLVLPLYIFGPNSDLVLRGSIPALTILAFLFSGLLVAGSPARLDLRIAATALAGLAAVTGGFELARVFIFPRYSISNCDFMSVQQTFDTSVPSHYLVRVHSLPDWLLKNSPPNSAIRAKAQNCWPDYPFDPRLTVYGHSTRELLAAERSRRP
jgi:hypothetical protein